MTVRVAKPHPWCEVLWEGEPASALLVASTALPAAANRSRHRAALLDLSENSCSLGVAVHDALTEVPGTVVRARLKRSQKPGQEPIWFYKVVSLDAESTRVVQRFDAENCGTIEPTAPGVDMPTALAAALDELGGGLPVSSRLHFPGLEPVYRIVALLPRAKMVVYVDGVTGELLGARRWNRRLDEGPDAADEEAEDDSL